MTHGTLDWGVTAGVVTTYQLTDLGELAARLGSINFFDRRGDVLFLDDFENGLDKWEASALGGGGGVCLSTDEARSGLYSCRLTAGDTLSRLAQIVHAQAFPALTRLGVEFSFHFPTSIDNLELRWEIYTGSRLLTPRVKWSDVTGKLTYRDSAGVEQVIASGVVLAAETTLFHVPKVVVNVVDEEYVRVILDADEYSLSGLAVEAIDSSAAPRSGVAIRNTGRAGFNDAVYVDDVILTQNEPT